MRAGTNLPAVGGYNQTVILDAIRRASDGISRVEVAERTGLSAQTISNVCRRLLDAGLIRESGTQASGVGKPRTIMELEPGGRFAIGVHLEPTVSTVVVLTLAGAVVAHRAIPTREQLPSSETIENIVRVAREVSAEAGAPSERIMGAGIAAPGPVDVRSGTVLNPPLLAGWQNVPVRDVLAETLNMPVLLEKDVTAAAVAELWMNSDPRRGNMVFFYYGTGVGAGIIVQNEVIRGLSSNAGDIGSVIVGGGGHDESDRRWRLGDAVMPRYLVREAIGRGVVTERSATGESDAELSTADVIELFARLGEAATAGVGDAVEILDAAAQDIATALVTIINLLDTSTVIFGGPFWGAVGDFMLARIPDLVRMSPVLVSPHPITFAQSEIGEDVAAIGAACLVLDHAFSPHPAGLLIQRTN
jgi:predicted NBD/HSP70 family sugar kinase